MRAPRCRHTLLVGRGSITDARSGASGNRSRRWRPRSRVAPMPGGVHRMATPDSQAGAAADRPAGPARSAATYGGLIPRLYDVSCGRPRSCSCGAGGGASTAPPPAPRRPACSRSAPAPAPAFRTSRRRAAEVRPWNRRRRWRRGPEPAAGCAPPRRQATIVEAWAEELPFADASFDARRRHLHLVQRRRSARRLCRGAPRAAYRTDGCCCSSTCTLAWQPAGGCRAWRRRLGGASPRAAGSIRTPSGCSSRPALRSSGAATICSAGSSRSRLAASVRDAPPRSARHGTSRGEAGTEPVRGCAGDSKCGLLLRSERQALRPSSTLPSPVSTSTRATCAGQCGP